MKNNEWMHRMGRWIMRLACVMGLCLAFNAQSVQAQGSEDTGIDNVKNASDRAAEVTQRLNAKMRGTAGAVLVAAMIFSAVCAAIGQYKLAFGVATGAIILYGGIFVLGMIRQAMNVT